METIFLVLNVITVIQFFSSAIMCVFGYKWSKGLIAIVSSYVGTGIGCVIAYFLLQNGVGWNALWVIPIISIAFSALAYKCIFLNHFLAGFILSIKILFMIAFRISENMSGEYIGMFFLIILGISIAFGVFTCCKLNHYILIACVSYIGAIELTTKIFDWLNKGLFLSTGDISFIFDPLEFVLSFLGIQIPSVGEIVLILLIGIASFCYQRNKIISLGIDMSNAVVDDRKMYNK